MFERIITDPEILCGKPIIKGTRISVEFLLELAASGASRSDIQERYPQLSIEDIAQAFRFAGRSASRDQTLLLMVNP